MTDEDPRKFRYVDIRRAADGEYYYRVVAGNNEVLYHSETYPRHADAVTAAVREHRGRDNDYRYVLRTAWAQEPYELELNLLAEKPSLWQRLCRWLRCRG
jgi:uncharacterized protein YegP (UPF0339 family)